MIKSRRNKKILLVGSQRTFLKDFKELIENLESRYDVFIVLLMIEGVKGPRDILTKMQNWISAGSIIGFFVLPLTNNKFKFYQSIKELKSTIQNIDFTLCICRMRCK